MTGRIDDEPVWVRDQFDAAVADTVRAAAALWQPGTALIGGPSGPWSEAFEATVRPGNPWRRVCTHLAHAPNDTICPVFAIWPYRLICRACADKVLAISCGCAGCISTTCHLCGAGGAVPVVAHQAILVMRGALCRPCLDAEVAA